MSQLSDIEFAVMDEVYFPTSFTTIVSNTGQDIQLIKSTLLNLLKKQFVQQMKFNESVNDYERCLDADLANVEKYLYVASKKGLLEHNS